MSIEKIVVPGISSGQGLPHVSVATGSKVIFVSGQVSQDENGETVGAGDLAAQTEQALVNVHIALQAAGAGFDDVGHSTLYVVDWDIEKMDALFAGLGRAAERLGSAPLVPTTLIPVPKLFVPEHLIEIQVTAVVD